MNFIEKIEKFEFKRRCLKIGLLQYEQRIQMVKNRLNKLDDRDRIILTAYYINLYSLRTIRLLFEEKRAIIYKNDTVIRNLKSRAYKRYKKLMKKDSQLLRV